jgi:hypothetical protein
MRLTVAAPKIPATITQLKKKTLISLLLAPGINPQINPAARNPL